MKRHKRIQSKRRNHLTYRRTTIFGLSVLLVLTFALCLYFTNQRQQEKILSTYCASFGFGEKTLVLMKDSTFLFHYYGCSQLNGNLSGRWSRKGDTLLTLSPEVQDKNLDPAYKKAGDYLQSIRRNENEFILCEKYFDPADTIFID